MVKLPRSYQVLRSSIDAEVAVKGPEEPLLRFRMVELLVAAMQLPLLSVLEVTFQFYDQLHVLANILAELCPPHRVPVAVWDFSRYSSVQQAVEKLESAALHRTPAQQAVWEP